MDAGGDESSAGERKGAFVDALGLAGVENDVAECSACDSIVGVLGDSAVRVGDGDGVLARMAFEDADASAVSVLVEGACSSSVDLLSRKPGL